MWQVSQLQRFHDCVGFIFAFLQSPQTADCPLTASVANNFQFHTAASVYSSLVQVYSDSSSQNILLVCGGSL